MWFRRHWLKVFEKPRQDSEELQVSQDHPVQTLSPSASFAETLSVSASFFESNSINFKTIPTYLGRSCSTTTEEDRGTGKLRASVAGYDHTNQDFGRCQYRKGTCSTENRSRGLQAIPGAMLTSTCYVRQFDHTTTALYSCRKPLVHT